MKNLKQLQAILNTERKDDIYKFYKEWFVTWG